VFEKKSERFFVVGHVDGLSTAAVGQVKIGAVTQQKFDVFG
jgi:hypothetical protein